MRKSLLVMVGPRMSAVACPFLTGVAVVLAPPLALAADGQTYAIDTGPLISAAMPFLEAALMAVVTAATAWLSRKANKYLGVQLDAKHRAALNEGAESLINQLLLYATSSTSRTFYTRHQVMALVANGLLTKFPDAIKYFGLSSKDVEAFVLGRISKYELDELSGRNDGATDGATQNASAAVPSGYPSAPVDLSQAVAGNATAPQAGG
nr:hypothetical protein [uncultured Cohaesibacter sp.]